MKIDVFFQLAACKHSIEVEHDHEKCYGNRSHNNRHFFDDFVSI